MENDIIPYNFKIGNEVVEERLRALSIVELEYLNKYFEQAWLNNQEPADEHENYTPTLEDLVAGVTGDNGFYLSCQLACTKILNEKLEWLFGEFPE